MKNGKFYIGSTKNFDKRKKRHLKDLKNNLHHCMHLQKSYNKYGEDNFTFTFKIVKINNEKELRLIEERYINFCWSSGKLYNLSKKGCGGDLISYHPNNNEIRAKQSTAAKIKWELLTDEEKKEYSIKNKGVNNPNYNNKWTDEQKLKSSIRLKEFYKTHNNILKGKKLEDIVSYERAKQIKEKISEVSSNRIGEKNGFFGKHHSEETKSILSKKHIGNLPSNAKKVFYQGKVYESAKACSDELNIPLVTVCYRCRRHIYGFSYLGENNEDDEVKTLERWDLNKCEQLVKGCKTKKEYTEKSQGAVGWLKTNGLWDEFAKKYFIELRHRWSLNEIKELASKYNTYSDFIKNENNATSIMNRNNWRNEIKKIFQ